MSKSYSQFFEEFENAGMKIPEELKVKISERINKALSYEPKIGFFGKTGVGKSSLCNALFGKDICLVSDVESCTRNIQEISLGIGSKGMQLLDVPGVGESDCRDQEYAKLYAELLPKLDLVLWLIKADDKAFSSDEKFYKEIVKPHLDQGKPFFIVINQADKMEPWREWDEKERRPGQKQGANLDEKRRVVSRYFDIALQNVLAVSANEKYGLVELIDSIIYALPNEKKITLLREFNPEHISENARREAKRGLAEAVLGEVGGLFGEKGKKVGETIGRIIDLIPFKLPW